jgi:hypothetical protein
LEIACMQRRTQIEAQPVVPPIIVTTMASIETEITEFSSDSTPPLANHQDLLSRRPLIKNFYELI